ncbi:hypothetical protein TB2_028298 [Malus domestica]
MKRRAAHIRCNSSEEDLLSNICDLKTEETIDEDLIPEDNDSVGQAAAIDSPMSSWPRCVSRKLSNLAIPNRERYLEKVESATQPAGSSCSGIPVENPVDGYETVDETLPSEQDYMVSKKNLFEENHDETEEEPVPQESILKRINSHKRMESFQLGRQLSCKWITGAGPRNGCMRDYPSELQFQALEHVNLSPRSANARSPRVLTPTKCVGEVEALVSSPALERVKLSSKSINLPRTQSLQLFTGSRAPAIANVS